MTVSDLLFKTGLILLLSMTQLPLILCTGRGVAVHEGCVGQWAAWATQWYGVLPGLAQRHHLQVPFHGGRFKSRFRVEGYVSWHLTWQVSVMQSNAKWSIVEASSNDQLCISTEHVVHMRMYYIATNVRLHSPHWDSHLMVNVREKSNWTVLFLDLTRAGGYCQKISICGIAG
jgi:hypothetical protein